MAQLADIGVLGLAVMGANLARNAARKGFGVALYNRNHERTDELIAEHGNEGRFVPDQERAEFVAALEQAPRDHHHGEGRQAGGRRDRGAAAGHLDRRHHHRRRQFAVHRHQRRFTTLQEKRIRFIGMGVSGGEEGALEGPSMMPGGERDAYDRIAPMVDQDGGSGRWHALLHLYRPGRRRPLRQDGA